MIRAKTGQNFLRQAILSGRHGFTTMPLVLIILAALTVVGGYFSGIRPFKILQKEVRVQLESQTQAQDETVTDSASLAVDWKNYRNEQYGFEVKYPESWLPQVLVDKSIGNTLSIIAFNSPETQQVSPLSPQANQAWFVSRIDQSLNIDDEINGTKLGAKTIDKKVIIQESKTIMGGEIARQIRLGYRLADSINQYFINTYAVHGERTYQLSLTAFGDYAGQRLNEIIIIYATALSTFKFID